jgi:hypothetical protein
MSEIDKQSAEKEPTPGEVEQASTIARRGLKNRKRELRYLNPEQQAQREQEHKQQDRDCLEYLLQHSDDVGRFAQPHLIMFLAREFKLDVQIVANTINRLRHRGLVTVERPPNKPSQKKRPINVIYINRPAAVETAKDSVAPPADIEPPESSPVTVNPQSYLLPGQAERLARLAGVKGERKIYGEDDQDKNPTKKRLFRVK